MTVNAVPGEIFPYQNFSGEILKVVDEIGDLILEFYF